MGAVVRICECLEKNEKKDEIVIIKNNCKS